VAKDVSSTTGINVSLILCVGATALFERFRERTSQDLFWLCNWH
jgi:hypothetical protein